MNQDTGHFLTFPLAIFVIFFLPNKCLSFCFYFLCVCAFLFPLNEQGEVVAEGKEKLLNTSLETILPQDTSADFLARLAFFLLRDHHCSFIMKTPPPVCLQVLLYSTFVTPVSIVSIILLSSHTFISSANAS